MTKWKKAAYLVLAAGIVGFAGYGIGHTVQALDSAGKDDGYALASELPSGGAVNALSDGSCHPLGCAACGGCTRLQYVQVAEAALSVTGEPGQTY